MDLPNDTDDDLPIDAGLGAPSPWDETRPAIDIAGVTAAVHGLVAKGLPATEAGAGPLLHLRSVYARATHPYDRRSRLIALNRLLVQLVAEADGARGEALRILLGVAAGTGGTNLTHRRQHAAGVLGYEVTHFRKEIESTLIENLANLLYEDLLRYKRRVRRAAESEEPTGDTPALDEWDLTHEEELISRIWQRVYELRAEIIATARFCTDPVTADVAADHHQAAGRAVTALRELIAEYTTTYGDQLIRHGDAEYNAEAIERLVGWKL